ncbi:hypothetical protein TNCV_1732731 [Trichonephila clavipes]|nr:hypothetical protein TNCV_1732731 [Trichonephila clavipes]
MVHNDIASGVTENIRVLLRSQVLGTKSNLTKHCNLVSARFWAPSLILQRIATWCQSGFGASRTLNSPQCGGVHYATGYCTYRRCYIEDFLVELKESKSPVDPDHEIHESDN